MHDLVVALFELAINVDVLDVKAGEVLKNFVVGPRLDVLKPLLDCIQIKNSAHLPRLLVRFSQLVRARP